MNIGRPQRIIEIEPVSLPLPDPELAPGARAGAREPAHGRARARRADRPVTRPSSGGARPRGRTTATEPIIAWRAWALTGRRDGRTSCCARSRGARVRGGRARSRRRRASTRGCTRRRTSTARAGSTARTSCDILRRTRCPAVLGRVALWGRVIEHELGYRAQFAYPQLARAGLPVLFLAVGLAPARAPTSWAGSPRDELVPLCWAHLEQAQRYGMEPRRLLGAADVDLRLRETYAVDPLDRW